MPTSDPSAGSVWLRPERPPRDRRLDRGRIVAAAVAVLDAEGHRGLSMRRIAADLGVTAGSLYWYVNGKDDLLELALDHVLGEVRADPEEPDWRRALGDLARSQRAMLLRHRWVLPELAVRPNLGPNALALAETGLGLLARAGFADADLDAAMAALNDHVVGAVIAEISWRDALARMRDTGTGWAEQAADHLRRVSERHPLLARRMAATREIDVERESVRRFEFALQCLLDGLAARRPR
ncbi:TetR/AcrR family transcriptional regulator [Thermomonospora cellulosilytica]|uniref:AcrR family transcriptional regulator n=1 Tax=Thermomonospora cellulosilytica TaxID=1411118 RepID=A0A7W3MXC0_9ACTN|nr:TetR/AcrR family transcriptional regulator [Thermomonospora cellulosilytica]MBA9003596.1 AcrR family transcriptional regulator [Thermomonospora cellulosilytica]